MKIGDFGLACADIIQKNTDWGSADGESKFVLVVGFVGLFLL